MSLNYCNTIFAFYNYAASTIRLVKLCNLSVFASISNQRGYNG